MSHLDEKFLPQTQIVFANTGIDDVNKPFFTSNAEVIAWIRARMTPGTNSITEYSFQRDLAGMPIRVDHNDAEYQALIQCDTVAWTNPQQIYRPRWMVAHITGIEWKNPNCSFVYYEIDWFTSFVDCIDWEKSICYIVREHVKKDWDGNNPIFNNCGVAEDMALKADYRINATEWQIFNNTQLDYVVVAPYDKGANIQFNDNTGLRRYCGLTFNVFQSKSEVDQFLTTIAKDFYPSDHTSGVLNRANIEKIVGVFTVPRATKGQVTTQSITPPWVTSVGYRNAKCWSSNFNFFRLFVPMGDRTIDFSPEYIGNSYSTFTLEREVDNIGDGIFMRVGPVSQRFSEGRIPNADMSVFITDAPQGAWVGDQYGQWKTNNGIPRILNLIMGSISTMASTNAANARNIAQDLAGNQDEDVTIANAERNALSAVSKIGQSILDEYMTWQQAAMNGASIGGTGGLGQNAAFEHYGFTAYMYFYQVSPIIMQTIDQYFDRFGYKVNALRAINPSNRPRWYYVRTVDAHIADRGGVLTIGSMARHAIEALLNTGVTIFRTDNGVEVGDFSNPEQNKGI